MLQAQEKAIDTYAKTYEQTRNVETTALNDSRDAIIDFGNRITTVLGFKEWELGTLDQASDGTILVVPHKGHALITEQRFVLVPMRWPLAMQSGRDTLIFDAGWSFWFQYPVERWVQFDGFQEKIPYQDEHTLRDLAERLLGKLLGQIRDRAALEGHKRARASQPPVR
ncbi:hypothetical protein [Polyangium spumosum]|uniref:Uncharacterized protein n=1 Tax=Polyangium spumosum TaxID=889282 RepID=A0A6N7PU05_9BACT|nr:hypothetical protein [Polyangium spumosum]MRG94276.1 hypothetical protein [Polyangium spumosum]